jgi:hypothetical protein
VGSGSSPLSCGVFLSPPLSQAFPLVTTGWTPASRHVCLQLMWEVGFSPPLLWIFPPSSTLTSFPAPGSWVRAPTPARASPARPGLFIYSSGKDFPSLNLRHSVCPTLFPTCLYCSYCLLLSLSFFPRWVSVCLGGYADLAHGCLWEYHGTTKLTLSVSFQAIWVRTTGGSPGALLVSPFNMKWRCSALAGCVEGSKFCLFLVVLPARCVSRVSRRFHTFCFLSLAAILESALFNSFLTA